MSDPTHEVSAWLETLGLGRYGAAFRDNDIDWATLAELDDADLRELGVRSLGHRKRILREAAALGSGRSASPVAVAHDPHRVPRHLAERILASRGELEGERKLVSILFADLTDSTRLVAGLGADGASEIMHRLLTAMMAAVHRYDGTVNRVQGDGLMAMFGAPIAHEDHAARACYAALAMRQAIREQPGPDPAGYPVQLRVGLHSGEVVVRAINNDLSMNYDAVGITAHLAARMEQLAEPGSIRLTRDTARLADGLFELEPLGPRAVKGLDEPVEVFDLEAPTRARTRWQVALRRGLSRFVGRETSFQTITDALDRAHGGQGQVVAVFGDAGVGKSRLVYELARSAAARGWQVLTASSVAYGKASDWLPVIDLLTGYFGIEAEDASDVISRKIRAEIAGASAGLEAEIPVFLALFDAHVDDPRWHALGAAQQRRRTLNAIQSLLIEESRRQPLLLVFEDLQWIDAETQGLLDELVESLPASRMLLLVDYRPEYTHAWSNRSHYAQVHLEPLEPANAETLLAERLGTDGELERLRHLLLGRAEGNPLFIEESVRALADGGVLEGSPGAYRLADVPVGVEVPTTIQAILAERIDRLAPESKQLLQAAAAIGTHVPMRLLLAVAGLDEDDVQRGLGALCKAEFLHQAQLYPEPEYTFKHALTHEVARSGLLAIQRRALHGRIAAAIRRLYPERLTELAEKLAEHLEVAERSEEAAEAWLVAASKGKARFAYASAAAYADRALQLSDRAGSDHGLGVRAQTLLGDLAGLRGDFDEANEHFEQALARADDETTRGAIGNRLHRRRFVDREGARIAYYEHGHAGETLLFVQPNAYRKATFQPVVEALLQEFRVVTFDPMGTGSSDPTGDVYGIAQRVEDIRAVVEALDRGPVVGIGLSRGGTYVLRTAASYPRLFSRLVSIGAPRSSDDRAWPDKDLRQATAIANGDRRDFDEFIRSFAYRLFPEPEARDLAEAYVRNSQELPPAVFRTFLGALGSKESILNVLGDVVTPTLVMHGTNDRQIVFEAALGIVAAVRDGRLYRFEGKGHQPYLTATREFCDALRGFVRTGQVPQ